MIKKIITFVAIVIFASSSVFAQQFDKGDKALNLGIGMGWSTYNISLSPIPSFNGSFEAGILQFPNVGTIGVGAFAGFRFSPYSGGKYTNTIIAARGVFHFQFFDTSNFDLYAGLHTGLGYTVWNYDNSYISNSTDTYFVDDVFVGARWMPKKNLGFFAELGYGISYLKAGVALKF